VNYIIPLFDPVDHLFDELGRILQIGVDSHNKVTRAEVHARSDSGLIALIPGEMEHFNLLVLFRKLIENLSRIIHTPIIDENKLEFVASVAIRDLR
jgi:hypothetical protein